MNASTGASADIATPPGSNGLFASLLAGPALRALAARLGAKLAAWWRDPIRFGDIVIVARHANVMEALHRDLDFLIAPVNEKRISTLVLKCRALYEALAAVDLEVIRLAIEDEAAKRVAQADDKSMLSMLTPGRSQPTPPPRYLAFEAPTNVRSWMSRARSSGTSF